MPVEASAGRNEGLPALLSLASRELRIDEHQVQLKARHFRREPEMEQKMKKWRTDADAQLADKGESIASLAGRALTDTELKSVGGGMTEVSSFYRSNPDGSVSFERISVDG